MSSLRARLSLVFTVLSLLAALAAQHAPKRDFRGVFRKLDVMIPMRDGIRLHTEIYLPRAGAGPLPILMERTPYGVEDDRYGDAKELQLVPALIKDGYIFVFQDIRGRYKSEGTVRDAAAAAHDPATPRPSTRAPTPTTPSTGC